MRVHESSSKQSFIPISIRHSYRDSGFQHPETNIHISTNSSLDEPQLAIVIGDAFGQVDIRRDHIPVQISQVGANHGNRRAVLTLVLGEFDVFGAVGEVDTAPIESAWKKGAKRRYVSFCWILYSL